VDLLERHLVRLGLGAPEDLERAESPREDAVGQLGPLEQSADFGEMAVGFRLARLDLKLERLEAVAFHALLAEREAVERERPEAPVDLRKRRSARDEGAHAHAPRCPRHATEVDDV